MAKSILRLGVIALGMAMFAREGRAQDTDGYHAIQVFPIVVDSASFTQRFHFRATYPWDTTDVAVSFYPAQGVGSGTPLACPGFSMTTGGEAYFASLRDLCPGLPAGSVFGTLIARDAAGMAFAAASRVSNPSGNGFAVEAFPAEAFTSASTAVTGLRRLAATAGSPAFQTNCFVGNLAELSPSGAPVFTNVDVALRDHMGGLVGAGQIGVLPGQLVRILDVFAWANAAPVDMDNVVATFTAQGPSRAALLTFCTVQDNTSFGADFRIGKQEYAFGADVPGAQDGLAMRWTVIGREVAIDDETWGTAFSIPAGSSRNVHLIYLRHPDVIGCHLLDPTYEDIDAPYGLELRLRALETDGWHTVAGGNDVVGFSGLYLGDKPSHGNGANMAYQIEVESNGQNLAADRRYLLACTSGSGHTQGELIRKGLAPTF